jgi:hypothetical protein
MKHRTALISAIVIIFQLLLLHPASATTHRLVSPAIFAKVLRVHNCEEEGNWFVHGPSYFGGLGWQLATWLQYRLPGFPPRPDLATPQEQARAMLHFVVVGEHGWWPDQVPGVCHGY